MLLQKLNEYADRPERRELMPPRLYTNAPVRYIIELNGEGKFIEFVDTATKDKATKRGERRDAPEVVRTSGVSAFLLADKADYVLGYAGEKGKPQRVATCHEAFRELVDRCAVATEDPRVMAVSRFLRADPLANVQLPADFDSGAKITFRIDDEFVIDLPAVQEFWAETIDDEALDVPEAQCIVCGRRRRVAETIEKVKGIPGGQIGGTSIVSFNAQAFLSYNLEPALNAPVCESCGARFTKSLNALLRDAQSHVIVGDLAYVFWTREPKAKFSFATFMTEPTADLIKQLYTSPLRGKKGAVIALDEENMSRFYAVALSASGGRAVVREWIDTSIAEAKAHLARWFRLQEIVPQFGEAEPLNIRQLAYATVRTGDRKNPPPANVTRALIRSALQGEPVPRQLLFEAVRRNRAEQSVTRPRAALIKMVLLSQPTKYGLEDMVRLNPTETNAAYRCGRLLAVIESIQREAMRGADGRPFTGATVVDRFYGTASSAPASVFGRLMRGAQPHLSKLERDRAPAWYALQRQMQDVLGGLPEEGFPRMLTLVEQGLFGIGYYHERARRWAGKSANPDSDADNAATGGETDDTMQPDDGQKGA